MWIPKKYWVYLLLCFCLVALALSERSPRARKKGSRAPQWKRRSAPKKGESEVVVKEKKNLKLDCSAHGVPKPNIIWTRNGQNITHIPHLKIKMQKYSLVVQNVKPKDSGDYSCYVFNMHGDLSFTYNVRVTGKTTFEIIPPSNLTVAVGRSATFVCQVKGNQSVTIEWTHNSMSSMTRKDSRFLQQPSNPEVLYIQNVTHDHAGKYTCLVGNSLNLEYVSAWLTVVDKKESNDHTMPTLVVSTWKVSKSLNYLPDMEPKRHANETSQQSRETFPAFVSIWTIYIIVGSVSGGVLLIGLITIIVAVCCQKENTGTYKSTNV
ncbi:fibroblast growth factor receptor 1-like [Argonauta hians]